MLTDHVQPASDVEGGGCLGGTQERLPAHSFSAARSWEYIYIHDFAVAHTTL